MADKMAVDEDGFPLRKFDASSRPRRASFKTQATAQKGGLKWDEDNIKYNDDHKVPHMKIDEPKTPFNFAYFQQPDPELMEDAAPVEEGGRKTPNSPHGAVDMQAHMDALHSAVANAAENLSKSPGDDAHKHDEFEKRRKQHYSNEAALMRSRHADEDDEDEA